MNDTQVGPVETQVETWKRGFKEDELDDFPRVSLIMSTPDV